MKRRVRPQASVPVGSDAGHPSVSAATPAIGDLADRWRPRLRAMARRHGARGAEVDEVEQDALLLLVASAVHLRPETQIGPWLSIVVRHRVLSMRRDARRLARLHAFDSGAIDRARSSMDAAEAARGREVVDAVGKALDALPPPFRDCLRLHLFEGLSPVEIAERLQLRRVTVRLRLFRGLRKLRRMLPQSLSLLLLFALSSRGRSQTPAWAFPVVASLSLALAGGGLWAAAALADEVAVEAPRAGASPAAVGAVAEATVERHSVRVAAPVPVALTVTLVARDGGPVAGVGVEIAPSVGFDRRVYSQRGCTAGDGCVAFATAPAATMRVRTDRGHDVVVDCRSGGAAIKLACDGGLDVCGRVLDSEGRAISDAAIWLQPPAGVALDGMDIARCGADGRFTLRCVAVGSTITARNSAFAAPVPRAAVAGGEMVFVLDRAAGAISGCVVDPAGMPIGDAFVAVGPGADGPEAMVAPELTPLQSPPYWLRTDTEGRFCSGGLLPGRWPLFVRTPGFACARLEVTIDAGATADVRCQLQRCGAIRGVVRNEREEPMSKARIYLRCDDVNASCDLETDATGHFECSVLSPGSTCLTVRARDCAPLERTLVLGDSAVEVDLRVTSLPKLAGRVRRSDGTPMTGWSIALPNRSGNSVDVETWAAKVDASGAVTLRGAPNARLADLMIQRDGAPFWTRVGDLALEQSDGSFELSVPDARLPAAELRLELRDELDAPMAGAPVAGYHEGQRVHLGTADAEGVLVVDELPAGTYEISAGAARPSQPALLPRQLDLAPGERRREAMRAAATGRLRYRLWREDGSAPRAPIVWLEPRGSGQRCAVLHGVCGEQVLTPGSYSAHVIGDDFVWGGGDFEVRAGEVALLECALRPACKRMLSLGGLPPELHGTRLAGVLRDAVTGAVLYRFSMPLDAAVPLPLRSYLPAGRIRFDAQASNGRGVRAEFELPDEEPDPRPRDLQFRLVN